MSRAQKNVQDNVRPGPPAHTCTGFDLFLLSFIPPSSLFPCSHVSKLIHGVSDLIHGTRMVIHLALYNTLRPGGNARAPRGQLAQHNTQLGRTLYDRWTVDGPWMDAPRTTPERRPDNARHAADRPIPKMSILLWETKKGGYRPHAGMISAPTCLLVYFLLTYSLLPSYSFLTPRFSSKNISSLPPIPPAPATGRAPPPTRAGTSSAC